MLLGPAVPDNATVPATSRTERARQNPAAARVWRLRAAANIVRVAAPQPFDSEIGTN